MTSSATAENNCHNISYDINLKDVNLCKVSIYYSDTPDIVHVGPGLNIEKNENYVKIYNSITRSHFYYLKSNERIDISPDEVRVYRKKYLCSLTKTVFEERHICHVSPYMAISEYNIKGKPSWRTYRENVPVIRTPGLHESCFVFNYVDACKQKILLLLAILKRRQLLNQSTIQVEVIENYILPILGYVEVDGKITHQMNPFSRKCKYTYEYTCEYKGHIPKYVSMAQLKQLYELGMVKMMILSSSSVIEDYCILSDDAFDNDPDGFLQKKFETKFNMHGYIERELKRLFL